MTIQSKLKTIKIIHWLLAIFSLITFVFTFFAYLTYYSLLGYIIQFSLLSLAVVAFLNLQNLKKLTSEKASDHSSLLYNQTFSAIIALILITYTYIIDQDVQVIFTSYLLTYALIRLSLLSKFQQVTKSPKIIRRYVLLPILVFTLLVTALSILTSFDPGNSLEIIIFIAFHVLLLGSVFLPF